MGQIWACLTWLQISTRMFLSSLLSTSHWHSTPPANCPHCSRIELLELQSLNHYLCMAGFTETHIKTRVPQRSMHKPWGCSPLGRMQAHLVARQAVLCARHCIPHLHQTRLALQPRPLTSHRCAHFIACHSAGMPCEPSHVVCIKPGQALWHHGRAPQVIECIALVHS